MTLRAVLIFFLLAAATSTFSQSYEKEYDDPLTYPDLTQDKISVQLFPNPTPDYINIKLGQLKADHVKLSFHNIIGNEMEAEVEKIDDHLMRIRVKEMAPGYYFITIKDETSRFRGTFKFLKR